MSQSLSSPQLSHNDSHWAKGITKSHREQGLDYRECEELSWCLCQIVCDKDRVVDWCIVLVTDPIWRVLTSSDWISSWTPLKPQHSNPNPDRLANQLWCIDYLTTSTPLIIPHKHPAFLESLMPLKKWFSIRVRWSKSCWNHSIRFCGIIISKFKT